MSADSQWDVQTSLYTTLSSDATLTALLANGAGSVLDYIEEDTSFPYVVISDSKTKPFDTQLGYGVDMTVSIHSWSRYKGLKETKQIMSAIYDALHDMDLVIPNQTTILSYFESSENKLGKDGITRHGIQKFRIVTEPV